jgi:hypothetical protein
MMIDVVDDRVGHHVNMSGFRPATVVACCHDLWCPVRFR